ncbi:MAG: ATP-binding protein [Campylobacterota bacterium]|nr:ATP-binding protein [Campylobacterota bacterium]
MKLKFLITFFIVFISLFFILSYDKNNRINQVLEAKSKEFDTLYKAIYNQYKEEAQIIYNTVVNTKSIIDVYEKIQTNDKNIKDQNRKLLFNYIKDDYNTLKFISIRQLHFHLKNNDSFLRMHRPNKYGDNLTTIRPTIAYVNKYNKPIDGFEEGRIFNGFRFVFPITSYDGIHLGSVEISFSADAIVSKLTNEFKKKSIIHIDQSVVDQKLFKEERTNYIEGPFDGYLIDKEVYKKIYKKSYARDIKIHPTVKTINFVLNSIEKDEETKSIYDENTDHVISVLQIKNPVTKKTVAFVTSKSSADNLKTINNSFIYIFILSFIAILLILIYTYKQSQYKIQLEKSLQEQKKIILKDQEDSKEKEKLILQQSKMASMGEMIENIAHQWRQPLSIITTNASGILLKKDFDMLTDDYLDESLNSIVKTSEHLSKIIDDFRDYFKSNKDKENINIKDTIVKTLDLLSSKFKNSEIEIRNEIKDITFFGLKNELIQVFMNILNNSKDALIKSENIKKVITIKTDKLNENGTEFLQIVINDNGGGIQSDIINKIFEPYFTTKHKSQGTGIGLYMVREMIVKHMNGTISVENIEINIDDTKYIGVAFTIELPLSS